VLLTRNVASITMAAMAALGVRSTSLLCARSTRSRCKQGVSANASERARTLAKFCHAEGRGFESHHPLNSLQKGIFWCLSRQQMTFCMSEAMT
jgi:hypothetical protein